MEFLTPIFHIFSGLVVKKLPSSSLSFSGPPTEDRSNVPTREALDDAYLHIRDLERQVALSEGKLQESQRCFDSVISSLASHIEPTVSCVNDLRSSMEHNIDTFATLPAIIAKPSYAQVASLPAAVSSFTIPLPPREKVLLDGGCEVNFSIKSKSSNNWIISVISDLYPVIKDPCYLYLNFERVRIETFISVIQCSTCGTLGHTRNHCSNTQACFTDDHDRTSCDPRCINCTNHNVRFGSGFSENQGCRDKNCPILIQFKKRTMDRTDYGR
ncbi:hypothetical protein TNIN_201421 [Trichonephila inaurata madagascariensis]|uniref:CCHC-type domain-containing protein n=1 Tax=Trichonephila inaurata madagascariensis TaxID=2747483 RepID=A0A8X6WW35_9ARAC|nr:hypothetical protein TNIN_201421 [Trichonephila inaurata madagascariensis]